jgi:hypothetical protein
MQPNSSETAPPRASKGRGRPPYDASEPHREQVKCMAGYGIPHKLIAKALNLSAPTLRKHYRKELDLSAIEANTNVLSSLYRMATTRHNAAAAIFWAKTRCNYDQDPNGLGPKRRSARQEPPPPVKRQSTLIGLTAELNDGAPNGEF